MDNEQKIESLPTITSNPWRRISSTKDHCGSFLNDVDRICRSIQSFHIEIIGVEASIWFAHNMLCSGGMLEYHPDSDTVAPLIPYPSGDNRLNEIQFCKYKDSSIIIIQHESGRGLQFNTETHEFSDMFQFGQIFLATPSCIVIGDYLHIFHGVTEGNGKVLHNGNYIIYSMTNRTSTHSEGHCLDQQGWYQYDVAVVKGIGSYESSNKVLISGFIRNQTKRQTPSVIVDVVSEFCAFELFKFGGIERESERDRKTSSNRQSRYCRTTDSFHIGKLRDKNAAEPIQWTLAPHYKLKRALYGFGHIQHDQFIVIFGGSEFDSIRRIPRGLQIDNIYILDLTKKCGWVQSPIKCPRQMNCSAVLDANLKVHLKDYEDIDGHWTMDLNDIIPGLMQR